MEQLRKTAYLLHDYDFRITSKIQKVLEEILPSPKHAERHVKNHSFKYFYVVDKILSTNLKFEKSPKASQPVCYNSLYDLTSKVKIEVKSGNFITFAKLILEVLKQGKIIKMTRPHDRDKKLCAEYQVVWKGLGNYRVYPFDYITNSSTQQKFITKLRKQGKSEFFIGSPAAIKMDEWMNLLDFTWVKTDSLKHKSKLYHDYYKSNKFQIKAETGRIYNSFTNLPRVIREKTRVKRGPISELDLANAQGVFLASIVKNHLQKNNVIPDQSTIDFIHWTELGKLFEFLNGKLNFPSGKDRETFKKKLWVCIMSENKDMLNMGYKMVYSALEKEVPQVLDVITKIKEYDHTKMAFLLQNAEAEVMMKSFEKIIDESPSSLLHDALYFPTAHLEKNVKGFITELKDLEVRCTVKVTAKFDNSVLPTGDFNTTELQKVRYDNVNFRKGIFLTFVPEKWHLHIINQYTELFEDYPIELKAHAKPKFGRSLNQDFEINFESQKNNQAMYNSGILHSMLIYAGSGMANLRLNDVSILSPFDLLDIVEMSDANHIQKIFIGDQEISFQLLLTVWMKNNFDMCQEFEKGLILDLVKHILDFISNLVFGNNPLPDEVFPYGCGCYQIDEKQFLLALNSQTEKSPRLKLFEKLYSQDLVFQIICKDQLDHLFGTLDYLKSDAFLFENRLHQLDFKSYVKYLENWLKANCIELKDGEILVYPENLDDDDFYLLHG